RRHRADLRERSRARRRGAGRIHRVPARRDSAAARRGKAGARAMRFLVNDPDYAPFGAAWLRGITPLRVGALLVICMTGALNTVLDWFLVHNNYMWASTEWVSATIVRFSCALPMFILVIKTEIHT